MERKYATKPSYLTERESFDAAVERFNSFLKRLRRGAKGVRRAVTEDGLTPIERIWEKNGKKMIADLPAEEDWSAMNKDIMMLKRIYQDIYNKLNKIDDLVDKIEG